MREGHIRRYLVACLAALVVVVPALAKNVVGTSGADLLRGTPGADKLYGKAGNDRLFGLAGDDLLVGGAGRDLLEGGPGKDRLLARDGASDRVRCGSGQDTAVVDSRDRVASSCEIVLPPPPAPTTFVIAGAGDIAGSGSGDDQTARLLDAIKPDVVFTTGDNAYPDGTLSEFRTYYQPTWGRHKPRTRPSPGNHDYHTEDASGYFSYFGSRAPAPYYSYDLGGWHLISLNSEISMAAGSPQATWLKADLTASNAACTLAYWHKPRYSAGKYRDFTFTVPVWELLYAEGAELVLNGHDHNYQRYRPMDPDGSVDTAHGIREIVVGTGGASFYELRSDSRREAGQSSVYGVLEVTLRPGGYDWRFVPVSGSYADSGSASCR
jgi:hypothetical protein